MSDTAVRAATIVLAGNPNVGKSTLFNTLTRSHQKVVNAPGTTVTMSQGRWALPGTSAGATLVDLPGTYSLISRSPDEDVAAAAVRDRSNDLVVVVLDATALSRSLYLLAQVAQTGAPVVVAVTMMDVGAARGLAPDLAALRTRLGVPVVEVNGRTGAGTAALASAVTTALDTRPHVTSVPGAAQDTLTTSSIDDSLEHAELLFGWVEEIAAAALPPAPAKAAFSDRLDRVLLNPWLGVPLFLAVVWGVFQLTTVVAAPVMDGAAAIIDGPVTAAVTAVLGWLHAPAWLESFAISGLIAGVGAVVSFVPLMAIIFSAVTVLEASGYLARVAVVADRVMRSIGLDGRAMLPLVVGFGCNLPALSATAVLPHARQRLLTGLMVPLTSCTARLTVYLLLAQTFFPGNAGTVVFGMYVVSVLAAVGFGLLARRFAIRDAQPEPLVIALPDYQWPHLRTLLLGVWTRVLSFIRRAGSVIVVAVVGLWCLQAIPVTGGHALADVPIEDSLYGAAANAVAPALEPMGLGDWRIASSLVAGVAAKEVTVGSLAQAYSLEDPGDGDASSLAAQVRHTVSETSGGHPTAAGLAFMIFVLGYFPCLATMGEQRRLFGWRWTLGSAGAQLALTYLLAVAVFQVGSLL
ncbi:ferrous iron transporter B [Demequina sp.]|uniref:ferrous iron transporter B n=1 Tax=Demequina sp. TaxID=2050685 RepID=UPI003A8BFDFD